MLVKEKYSCDVAYEVLPNARWCKAVLDRITDKAHILETGTESYRFRRTAEKQKKGAKLH